MNTKKTYAKEQLQEERIDFLITETRVVFNRLDCATTYTVRDVAKRLRQSGVRGSYDDLQDAIARLVETGELHVRDTGYSMFR